MRTRKLSSALLGLAVTAATALSVTPAGAHPASTTLADAQPVRTVTAQTVVARYGPFTVPAMGMVQNQAIRIQPPCSGCFITAMVPDLVYADGSSANYNTNGMLHHAVFFSSARADATCANLGERFFASGNERTPMGLPNGYGYPVGATDQWTMLVDLMNMAMVDQTFYVQITYTLSDSSAALTPVRPVWLDIDQCGDSEYSIPAGVSDAHWDWTVNVPGRVVAAAGHSHDNGVRVEATLETGGTASICDSVAGYGETPGYIDPSGKAHISSMSTCHGEPLAVLARGDLVRLHSIYDSPEPQTTVMGIMIMYIA